MGIVLRAVGRAVDLTISTEQFVVVVTVEEHGLCLPVTALVELMVLK